MLGMYSYQNNVLCTLGGDITSASTSITFNNAQAPYNSPVTSVIDGDFYPAMLTIVDNLASPTKIEIIKLVSTAIRAGLGQFVFTVERAQEGTTAHDWPEGSIAFQAVTKGQLEPDGLYYKASDHAFVTDRRFFFNGLCVFSSYATFSGGVDFNGEVTFENVAVSGLVKGGFVADKPRPANSNSPGTAKEIRVDNNYIYVCVGTNNWKRVALSAF